MQKIVYVCDINEDIDDMIAVEYLHINNRLDYVVLDRTSTSSRIDELKSMGVVFKDKIEKTNIVFCGGAFTKVAEYLKNNKLDYFVANGGFVGCNIIKKPLEKFKGKETVRTFNLNLDVNSGLEVLKSKNVDKIRMVSKNVCHSDKNCFGKMHKDKFLEKYNLHPKKRLHDLLMVKEGLNLIDNKESICEYLQNTLFYAHSENKKFDKYTEWGTIISKTENNNIETTIEIRSI